MILVVIPVVYVLSVPPLVYGPPNHSTPGTYSLLEWVNVYARPYSWLVSNTPLQKPLVIYADYWERIFHGSPPP